MFKKIVIALLVFCVFTALIISTTCSGPIDSIFSGGRDLSHCSSMFGPMNMDFDLMIFDGTSLSSMRFAGALILICLLVIFLSIAYLFHAFTTKIDDEEK